MTHRVWNFILIFILIYAEIMNMSVYYMVIDAFAGSVYYLMEISVRWVFGRMHAVVFVYNITQSGTLLNSRLIKAN